MTQPCKESTKLIYHIAREMSAIPWEGRSNKSIVSRSLNAFSIFCWQSFLVATTLAKAVCAEYLVHSSTTKCQMFLGDLHRHIILLVDLHFPHGRCFEMFRCRVTIFLEGRDPSRQNAASQASPLIYPNKSSNQACNMYIYIYINPNSGKSGNLNVIASEAPFLHTAENTVKFNLLNPVPNRGQRPSCYHVQILSKVGEPRILDLVKVWFGLGDL